MVVQKNRIKKVAHFFEEEIGSPPELTVSNDVLSHLLLIMNPNLVTYLGAEIIRERSLNSTKKHIKLH